MTAVRGDGGAGGISRVHIGGNVIISARLK